MHTTLSVARSISKFGSVEESALIDYHIEYQTTCHSGR